MGQPNCPARFSMNRAFSGKMCKIPNNRVVSRVLNRKDKGFCADADERFGAQGNALVIVHQFCTFAHVL